MLSGSSPEIPSYIELPANSVTKRMWPQLRHLGIEPTMRKLEANCITELIRLQFGRSFKW
jgi:hypothetical protein